MVVLGWLLQALATVVKGTKRNVSVRFMDGPCEFALFAKRLHVWIVQLIRDGLIVRELEIDPDPLISSALEAKEVVMSECSNNQWASSDIEFLKLQRERVIRYRKKKRPLTPK